MATRSWCVIIFILAFAVENSIQTDLYISAAGTDSGDCTSDACATVKYALGQLSNNTETPSVHLFFSQGTYNESFTCSFNSCIVTGAGTEATTFDLRSSLYFGENATFENITVVGLNSETAFVFDFAKDRAYTQSNWVIQNVVFTDIKIFSIANISNSYFNQNLKLDRIYMSNVNCSSFCISSILLFGRQNIYMSNLLARGISAVNGSFYASSAVNNSAIYLDCDNVTVVYSRARYGLYSFSTSGGLMNTTMNNCNHSHNNFSAGAVFAMQIQYKVPAAVIWLLYSNSYTCFNYQYSFASLDKGGQSHLIVTNGTFDYNNTYASSADFRIVNVDPCVKSVIVPDAIESVAPTSNNTGIIVGVVVGVAVLAVLAFIVIFLVYRRKQNQKLKKDLELQQKQKEAEEEESDRLENNIKTVNDVQIGKRLGGGSFGDVYLGIWGGAKVACKKPQNENALKEFMKEAQTLQLIQHPNCVQFLGIYTQMTTGDKYMIFEYLTRGDLVNVLKEEYKTLSASDLFDMCEGMCRGLVYLEALNIMHRDVALRNLLVTVQDGQYLVKVSDFGMSRHTEGGEYSPTSETKLAIKWTAPEVISGGNITMKNDVWAFGITCWEIFSLGKAKPYSELTNKQASAEIPKGKILSQPEKCPDAFYNEVMKKCWEMNPDNRPTFKQIFEIFLNLRKRDAFARQDAANEDDDMKENEKERRERERREEEIREKVKREKEQREKEKREKEQREKEEKENEERNDQEKVQEKKEIGEKAEQEEKAYQQVGEIIENNHHDQKNENEIEKETEKENDGNDDEVKKEKKKKKKKKSKREMKSKKSKKSKMESSDDEISSITLNTENADKKEESDYTPIVTNEKKEEENDYTPIRSNQ